jgi:hypothetical protein
MMPIIDIGISVSVILAVVALYGFCLFSWWWLKHDGASAVYIYLTILLLGIGIDNTVEAYVRFTWINTHADVIRFTLWWPMRMVVEVVALCSLVGHMTYRVIMKEADK